MKKIIVAVAFAFAAFVSADAQKRSDMGSIVYSEPVAVIRDNNMVINVGADLSNLELKRRQSVTLTPMLRSDDGKGLEFRFAPFTVAGKGKDKSIERAISRGREHDTALSVKRNNGYVQMLDMEMTLPLEGWMRCAELVFAEDISGCRKCEKVYVENVVGDDLLPPAFEPVYRPSFESVSAESVEPRQKTYSATINFAAGSYRLSEDYMNNAEALAAAGKVVEGVKGNPNLAITKINIDGYASPEGNNSLNKSLSEKRAAAVAGYLENKYGINPDLITNLAGGENWLGLQLAVDNSEMKDKADVLRIIKGTDVDETKKKLREFNGGEAYRYMLRNIYPSLRVVYLTITYVAHSFTAEESAELIKTNPSLLSLSEIYEAAALCPVGSPEYIYAYETALKCFPDNPVVINNLAAVRLQSGDADAAIDLLRNSNSAAALNNLGIAYFIKGDYTRAEDYFVRSEKTGNANAKYNNAQFDRWKTEK